MSMMLTEKKYKFIGNVLWIQIANRNGLCSYTLQLHSKKKLTWIRIKEASKSGKTLYLLVRWIKKIEIFSQHSVYLYQSVVTTNTEVRDFYSSSKDPNNSYPIVYEIDKSLTENLEENTQNFVSQLMEMFGSLFLPGEKPFQDLNTNLPMTRERPFDILKLRVREDENFKIKHEYEVGEAKQKINSAQITTVKKMINKTAKSKIFTDIDTDNCIKKLSKLSYVKAELIKKSVDVSKIASDQIKEVFSLSKTLALFVNPRQFNHCEKIIIDEKQQKILVTEMTKKKIIKSFNHWSRHFRKYGWSRSTVLE